MNEFVWTLIVAFLFQNVVFSRGFGTGRILHVSEDTSLIWPYSLIIMISMIFSSFVGVFVSGFKLNIVTAQVLEPLIFVGSMTLAYYGAKFILRKKNESWARRILAVLSPAMINTTVLGTVLIAYRGNYTLPQYMGLSVGTGLGFAAAAFVIHSGMERIEKLNVGPSFRGLPIKLIYIGIIAVGIYGFIGKSILL